MAGAAVEEVGAPLHGQPVQHAEQGVQAGTGCQVISVLLCIYQVMTLTEVLSDCLSL